MAFAINNRRMARNTIAMYIRMAITMAIGFFTARVTLEQLGVEDYGLNNLVGCIVSMFSFINGSMGTAVQRFYSIEIGKENEIRLKNVFGTGLYLHLWVAFVTVLLAEFFAIFFLDRMNIPENRLFAAHIVFQISIFSLALNILNVPYSALLKAHELFDKVAVIEVVQSLMRLGILYLLIIIDFDKLIVFSLLGFCVTLLYVTSINLLARRFDETHSNPIRDKELIKEMLSFISLLLVTVLCSVVKTQGLVMLINLFFGLAINAAYAVAVQVSNLMNGFVMSFKQSMVPQLMAACGAKDYESMHKIINMGTKITFILLLMLSIPVLFESDFLLTIWLKNPPEHASYLVVLVLVYVNLSSFTYFHYQGAHATGNIKSQQIWMSCMYLINVLIIYILFKFGAGFYVAIWVNIFVSLVQCIINLRFARKLYAYNIRDFAANIISRCLAITGIVCGVDFCLVCLMVGSFFRFVIVFVVSELLLLCLGYCILLDKREKDEILALVKKNN